MLILGGGPNRIGQGIEFDYCCCHASFSLRDAGYETIMMNSNPETVSTDYDTSSRLYFEPLTVSAQGRPGGWCLGLHVLCQEARRAGLKYEEPRTRSYACLPLTRYSACSHPASPSHRPQVEDVLNVIEKERPEGIIVQFGGQTPLKLATALQKALEDNPIPAASGEWRRGGAGQGDEESGMDVHEGDVASRQPLTSCAAGRRRRARRATHPPCPG